MKKFFKWLGISVLGVLLIVSGLVINTIWFKPFFINAFYERAFLGFALESPEVLSSIRLFEQFGIDGHNAELDDISPAATARQDQRLIDNLAMLRQYNRDALEGQKALSYDIMEWFFDHQTNGIQFNWHDYPVNQLFGVQNGLPDFMVQIHQVNNVKEADYYIARLSKFDTKFEQLLEGLRLRESKNIIPPRFVVEKVLVEMKGFAGTPAEENILYTSFVEKLDKIEDIDDATRKRLTSDVAAEISNTVFPAYQNLIAYFEELDTKATENYGVWNLPDGAAYYAHQLRNYTTTNMTPDEIHQIGLSEVARIETEMDELLRSEGYTEGTVAERVLALNDEERFVYPNTDEGREEFLAHFDAIYEEINAGMDEYFDLRPKAELEVKRIPEFTQATAPGAYYQGPSMDGSRPGVFFVNMRDLKEQPKFAMRTLAYHEGIPGHHFQGAIQNELTGVPQFRKLLGYSAFSEGWALYTERLAWEAGYQDDPYDNLGRLRDEMLRAVRLVVDTGIHSKRWSREQAIDYMASKTGMPQGDVVSEIERYFVLPGQACSYKIGMLKILELRERAKTALGDRFDIKDFHNVVLRDGEMPLEILERRIDTWLAEQSST